MNIRKTFAITITLCCVGCYFLSNFKKLCQYLQQIRKHYFDNDVPVILFYTSWNLEEFWSDLDPGTLKNYLKNTNCSIADCQITYDKDEMTRASAVLFHAQDLTADDLYSPDTLRSLARPEHQRWIWVNQESPANIKNAVLYDGLFNWTATYHRSSDIFLPYGKYITQHNANNFTHKQFLRETLMHKKKLVAWVVSDCGGLREKIALKLQRYLNITVFGKCNKKFKFRDTCIKGTAECRDKLKQYKFYLSFENSVCEDYVTEKYWENALLHNSVPVVFGANYDAKVAIPDSFIDVRNFKSIIDMANYISFLDKNDDLYSKYFNWKLKYKVTQAEDLLCIVCKKLHHKTTLKKSYQDLGAFWSKKRHCYNNNDMEQKNLLQLA